MQDTCTFPVEFTVSGPKCGKPVGGSALYGNPNYCPDHNDVCQSAGEARWAYENPTGPANL